MSENTVRLYAYQCAEYYLQDRYLKSQQNQIADKTLANNVAPEFQLGSLETAVE